MQGVQREDEGHETAAPPCAGDPFQEREQKQSVARMEHDIRHVMRAAAKAEKLAIQHVEKPREWKPVRRFSGSESPNHAVSGQPVADVRVTSDVSRIVIVDEFVIGNLTVDGGDGQDQKQPDPEITSGCHKIKAL